MTPVAAKLFLFDRLAEELATLLPGQLPARLAVKIDNMPENFPSQEVVSLATSFCRLRFPLLEEVPTCYWKNMTDYLTGPALIIDAERETLANINVSFQGKTLPDFIVVTNYDDDGSGYFAQISYNLQEDRDITRTAIEKLFQELGIGFESVAPIRFTQGGFDRLAKDFHLFKEERQTLLNRNDPKDVEQFCYNTCKSWQYEGKPLDSRRVAEWVNQFKQAGFVQEACEILHYLRRYGFLTENKVTENIASRYDELEKSSGKELITMTLQPAGKSEPKLAYRMRNKTGRLLPPEEAIKKVNTAPSKNYPMDLVCFDDFIGSGQSMRDYLFKPKYNPFATNLVNCFAENKARLTVLVSHADENGINALCTDPRGHGAITVMAAQTISDKHRAFHPDSPIFDKSRFDKSRIAAFKKHCEEIGKKINPGNPLGWNNAQWCIVTEYTVPNCSLPILWASGKGGFLWQPLFPRKRKA
jgi:hypothetical protein